MDEDRIEVGPEPIEACLAEGLLTLRAEQLPGKVLIGVTILNDRGQAENWYCDYSPEVTRMIAAELLNLADQAEQELS